LAAQAPAEPYQPVATIKQLMVEIIHPASNEILPSSTAVGRMLNANGLRFGEAP
jgi:hypothetical protein